MEISKIRSMFLKLLNNENNVIKQTREKLWNENSYIEISNSENRECVVTKLLSSLKAKGII